MEYNFDNLIKVGTWVEKQLVQMKTGAHVALTGGCLYKSGDRKDFDLVIYPNYSTPEELRMSPEVILKTLGWDNKPGTDQYEGCWDDFKPCRSKGSIDGNIYFSVDIFFTS